MYIGHSFFCFDELFILVIAERTAQYSDGKHQNRVAEPAGTGERHL